MRFIKKNYILKIIMFVIIISFFFPVVQADIISLNSGSGNEFVLTSDKYIEGFLFCNPITCAQIGYTCGTISDACGRNIDCGTCAVGYTCTAGTCVVTGTPPSDGPGGGGGDVAICDIAANPSIIEDVEVAINTNRDITIDIINTGSTTQNIIPTQMGFTDKVTFLFKPESFSIGPGQTKTLTITIVPRGEVGSFNDILKFGCKTVLTTIDVSTKYLLFDSNIAVLNDNYEVSQGGQLKTIVTLIPMGDPARLDVTLNFVIKDYNNKIYLTQSETLLVEKQVQLKRNFDTGKIPLGDYIVGLELVYSNGVAPSSAHFKIVERSVSSVLGKIILFLIILILIIAIIIIMILIIRKIKEKRQVKQT